MCQYKSYLTDNFFDHIERVEKMFPPNLPAHNLAAASWITAHAQSLEIQKLEKLSYC